MNKNGELYYPAEEFKKKAWLNDEKIYKDALKDPVKFWEKMAGELYWHKKWKKAFLHEPPNIKWFEGGKINITSNIFEKSPLDFKKIKDRVAIIWEPESIEEKERKITYGELFEEVNRFANALKKLGVKKGDRVGVYMPIIPEIVVALLACARIGAVHAVVFSAFSPAALRVRLQDTEAKVLITADGCFRRGKAISLKENADEGIKETSVEKMVVVRRTGENIRWDKQRNFYYDELIKDESPECEAEIMDAEDIFFILYTSGSTGKPKGCVHTCGGYIVQTKYTGKWIFDMKDGDIYWCTSDPGWITGHTYMIYSPLLNGITTLMFEGAPDWPTPDRWAQIIKEHGVTVFYTAPTAIRMFEKYGAEILKKYGFETLRLLGSVGEPIDEAAWAWYFEEIGRGRCPIVDTWWQTETGGILITSLPGIGPFKPAHTGLPLPGIRAEILDDTGKVCAAGQQGNLVLLPPFSPGFFRGIYKNPQKYQETYWNQYAAFEVKNNEIMPSEKEQKNKIYFTSDGALKDTNGLIRVIGRVDDAIKVAGHRITTGELEAAVNTHPEIDECAVVGIPDAIKGEVPVVFAVYHGLKQAELLKQEIIGQVRKQIGPIATPKEVYLVGDLPKTRSGKIMRRILRKLFTGEELGDLSTLSNPEIVEEIKQKIIPSEIK